VFFFARFLFFFNKRLAFREVKSELLYSITVQQDATYSVYYISLGSSTFFGCRHSSSGAGTAVITAAGID